MTWYKEKSWFFLVSFILGSLMLLFIVVPIIGSLSGSLTDLLWAVTNATTVNAIFTSFYCALLATVFIFALGVPFAYMFARNDFHGKKIVDSLIDLPILIPHNAAGIALISILAPGSPIGAFFQWAGIRFIDTIFGITVAMAFVSAPFMIRSAQEAFASVSLGMEKSARSLGANSFQVFQHVTFPLALRGILTGCLLTWARAVSEFGAVVVLAYYPKTIPVHLYDVFEGLEGGGGLKAALPISGLLIILAIVILLGFRYFTAKSTKLIQ